MKVRKKTLWMLFVLIAVGIAVYLVFFNGKEDAYSFSGDSFSYSQNRGDVEYETFLNRTNSTYEIYNLNFKSRNFLDYETKIYGLLFLPKGKEDVAGVVLLPGGGVKKESEKLAPILAENGYAVLTFDQRGIGQTGGIYLGVEQDYGVFSQGKEPTQHLSVFDALKAFDVLREIRGVDKDNIIMAGESMGGRYAIIAGSMDSRIKGVIGISTAGFHVQKGNEPYNGYLLSIDPDHYVSKISPRRFHMFHGTNDTTVPIKDAQITFNIANEPKKFFTAEGCGHGYCDRMKSDILGTMEEIVR